MNIEFADYISEERKSEIIEEAFREVCFEKFRTDSERIFSNAAYDVVYKIVDENFDNRAAEIVAEKSKSLIANLSEFTVFRRKDHWDREDSEGYKDLNNAIKKQDKSLQERISQVIENLDENAIKEHLIETAENLLEARLFGKGE